MNETTPPQGKSSSASWCTNVSAYTRLRASLASEPECRPWLNRADEAPSDTFLSQFGQDAMLFYNVWRCMDGPGKYLDLGANSPKDISNTWFLDKCLGWEGVCVEASEVLANALAPVRSCVVVAKALSAVSGSAYFSSGGTTGGHLGMQGGVPAGGVDAPRTTVQLTTLRDILTPLGSPWRHINFVSLDVEEHELDVLLAFPWEDTMFKFDFLTIENNRNFLDVSEFLFDRGYALLQRLGPDEIFMQSPQGPLRPLPGLNALRVQQAQYRRGALYNIPTYYNAELYEGGWDTLLNKYKLQKSV